MKTKCPKCKKEITSQFDNEKNFNFFHCTDCNLAGKGDTEKKADIEFQKKYSSPANTATKKTTELTAPKNKTALMNFIEQKKNKFIDDSPAFMGKPATEKMIAKNEKYIMKGDFKKAEKTPEGIESILDAFSNACEMGATLPEMGSIVPFGNAVEFIPSIDAFKFALTAGQNPPFSNINIDCIFKNDQYEISRKDGDFHFELKKIGFPRGDIQGVVVQATETDSGRMIGDAYDESRLMEKAEKHSISYQYYLKDMRALAEAKAKGKDYVQKSPTWKVYEEDIKNPYVGADKPEMLKKLAGKSFFNPYMKVRNARAMEAEWTDENGVKSDSHEKVVDNVLDAAVDAVDIVDAEIVVEKPVETEPVKTEKVKPVAKEKFFED